MLGEWHGGNHLRPFRLIHLCTLPRSEQSRFFKAYWYYVYEGIQVAALALGLVADVDATTFKTQNGFSFAARTSSGAVLYWAGDGAMTVHSVVGSGSVAVAVNRAGVAALTAAGYVEVAGVASYVRGYEAYQFGGVRNQNVR
jgi:hypothetical protein